MGRSREQQKRSPLHHNLKGEGVTGTEKRESHRTSVLRKAMSTVEEFSKGGKRVHSVLSAGTFHWLHPPGSQGPRRLLNCHRDQLAGQTAEQTGAVDLGAKATDPAYLSSINIKVSKSENAWLDTVRPKKYISNFKPNTDFRKAFTRA